MSNYNLARQNRRETILKGVSKDLTDSEIGKQIGVNKWVIRSDLKIMKKKGDPELKKAQKAQKESREEKQLALDREKVYIKQNERFQSMMGMSIQEKAFRNMIQFYKTELKGILQSKNQHSAIMKLSKSDRSSLINNGIITGRSHYRQVSLNVVNFLENE
jgi:hypothetical protein